MPTRAAEGGGLTEDQTRKYRAATKLRDEAEAPLLTRQRDGLAKIRGLIAAGKSDREVQRELDGLKPVFAELRTIDERCEDSLAKVLTSAQRAKLAAAELAAPKKGVVTGDSPGNVPGDEEEQE